MADSTPPPPPPVPTLTPPPSDDEPMLQWFDRHGMMPSSALVAEPFDGLAVALVASLPRSAERTVALRKLLEARDAAVRARMLR